MSNEMSDAEFAAGLGISEGEPVITEEAPASAPWFRDIDEDTGYGILQKARELPDQISALRDQAFGKMGGLERQLKELTALAQKVGTQSAIDPEPIRKVLEKYDVSLAASGLAEAIAEAVKVTPIDETLLNQYLSPRIGEEPLGVQLVLSHYSREDLASMIPPVDETGNLRPTTQRHKDFIKWYELQPHATQNALEAFGPQYVHSLRKFEQWEREQQEKKVQSSGSAVQRLAGGQVPSANRKSGSSNVARTAEEAFLNAWNED